MTSLDDNKDFIKVGIAKANDVDTIGDDLLEKIKYE